MTITRVSETTVPKQKKRPVSGAASAQASEPKGRRQPSEDAKLKPEVAASLKSKVCTRMRGEDKDVTSLTSKNQNYNTAALA